MNSEFDDDQIKVVEESKHTGKFKVGDKVKVVALTSFEEAEGYLDDIGNTGVVNYIDDTDTYTYRVGFNTSKSEWFNEATLELVNPKTNEIKRNNDSAVSKGRPASSHYHSNNNGNDVWKFADDNLSEERVKGFHQINAIKYVSRYNKKHDTTEKRIEDLKKAKVSIDKLIELEELE